MSKRHVRRNPTLATEHAEQCVLIEWWDIACKKYGLPPWSLMANINGAKLPWSRNIKGERFSAEANKLKAEGLRSGVPDLFLARPIWGGFDFEGDTNDCIASGLFIEMKRRPNKPSEDQERVIMYLRQHGYHVVVAYGFEEAKRAIEGYLSS